MLIQDRTQIESEILADIFASSELVKEIKNKDVSIIFFSPHKLVCWGLKNNGLDRQWSFDRYAARIVLIQIQIWLLHLKGFRKTAMILDSWHNLRELRFLSGLIWKSSHVKIYSHHTHIIANDALHFLLLRRSIDLRSIKSKTRLWTSHYSDLSFSFSFLKFRPAELITFKIV